MDLFVKFAIAFVIIYAVVGRVQVHSDHYVLLLFSPGVHKVFEMRSRFISADILVCQADIFDQYTVSSLFIISCGRLGISSTPIITYSFSNVISSCFQLV